MKRSRWDSTARRPEDDGTEGVRTWAAKAYTDDELSRRFDDIHGKNDSSSAELMDEDTVRKLMAAERNAKPSVDEDAAEEPPVGLHSPSPETPQRENSRDRGRGRSRSHNHSRMCSRSRSRSRAQTPAGLASGVRSAEPAKSHLGAGLEAGGQVRLDGLKAAAHLNGQTGRLERFDASSGRWQVRLSDGDIKAIRPENLSAEEEPAIAPPSPDKCSSAVEVAPQSPPPNAASAAPVLGLGGIPIKSGVGEIGGLSSAALVGGPPRPALARRQSSSSHLAGRRLGTIRWYNGRRKLGYIIPDGGGDDLFIPAQGASNGSQVPPQPGGLFHGTRVSFKPLKLKPKDESGSGQKAKDAEVVCMEVKPLPGQAGLSVGVDTAAGAKEKNDDRLAACDLKELGFFCGVFDGHRGSTCAEYVAKQLPAAVHSAYRVRAKREGSLVKLPHEKEANIISGAIKDAFESVDSSWLVTARKKDLFGGSTGIIALVSHGFEVPVAMPSASSLGCAALWPKPKEPELPVPEKRSCTVPSAPGGVAKLFIAWCGDARAVLLRGRQGLRVSDDHLPSRADEQRRIKQAGGMIVQDRRGVWRCGPRPDNKYVKELQKHKKDPSQDSKWFLSTSRSFGDAELKQPDPVVIVTPEVKVVDLVPEDWAVVLACDGIFDALSDQVVADCVWRCMAGQRKDPVQTAKEVVQMALKRGSKDNLTIIVMRLGWSKPPDIDAAMRGAEAAAKEAVDDGLSMFG